MTSAMMDLFAPLIEAMMREPPDPNDIPTSNRPGVAMGVTIPFHILGWIAVGFRLHTRFVVVREPGWDDVFVILAAVFNLISMIAFLECFQYGMGHHLLYALPKFEKTMICYYVTTAAYTTTTVLIKLSLLLQYLRLFRTGYRRIVVIVLIVIVSLWGSVFSFMAWFPCFPVKGFWDRMLQPPATCYGFGYRSIEESTATLLSYSGSNMALDFIILLVPLTEYFKPNIGRKQILAMTGLFTMGALVVLMAILRLWSGLKNRGDSLKTFDFTWWMPEYLIFSCLEVDFAIICASMPIFWPQVVAKWTEIFVTKEVIVLHEDDIELDRPTSLKSHRSTEGLTESSSLEGKSFFDTYDSDPKKAARLGITQIPAQNETKVSHNL